MRPFASPRHGRLDDPDDVGHRHVGLLPRIAARPDDADARMGLMLAALLCGQGTDHAGGGLASVLGHAIGPRAAQPLRPLALVPLEPRRGQASSEISIRLRSGSRR